MSYGSEGRRGNPAEEVPASSSVYEYIVFRGSDVKDISIASEEKKENTQAEAPRVPDDPAILGVSVPGLFALCLRFSWLYPHCGRPIDQMMKYFGCKHRPVRKAQKPCRYFPLPSF